MARSQQEADALKNELRAQIQRINEVSGIGLKYRGIWEVVNSDGS